MTAPPKDEMDSADPTPPRATAPPRPAHARAATSQATATDTDRSSFWRRRVVAPLAAQLRQGITPDKIALSLALGLVLGCFPILGAATLLCTAVGVALRLNQPVLQVVNQVAYPLQLALLIPHYRAGEWLFQTPPVPLSIPLLYERWAADWGRFLHDYGQLALQGIAVWCLLAPLVAGAVYFATRHPLRVLARGLAR